MPNVTKQRMPERVPAAKTATTSQECFYPSKVPDPPYIFVIAGLPRTGSTTIYNIVRLLLHSKDPNLLASYYDDISSETVKFLGSCVNLNMYVIAKTHSLPTAAVELARLGSNVTFIMSHRNTWSMINVIPSMCFILCKTYANESKGPINPSKMLFQLAGINFAASAVHSHQESKETSTILQLYVMR